jgi:hypothetical protein
MTDVQLDFAEYHRQDMACLTVARLSDTPEIQARWQMIAQSWFRLAEKTHNPHSPDPSDFSNVIPMRWGM